MVFILVFAILRVSSLCFFSVEGTLSVLFKNHISVASMDFSSDMSGLDIKVLYRAACVPSGLLGQ